MFLDFKKIVFISASFFPVSEQCEKQIVSCCLPWCEDGSKTEFLGGCSLQTSSLHHCRQGEPAAGRGDGLLQSPQCCLSLSSPVPAPDCHKNHRCPRIRPHSKSYLRHQERGGWEGWVGMWFDVLHGLSKSEIYVCAGLAWLVNMYVVSHEKLKYKTMQFWLCLMDMAIIRNITFTNDLLLFHLHDYLSHPLQ